MNKTELNKIKKNLLSMYKDAIDDAQGMWLSEYCCGRDESKRRKEEDKKLIDEFTKLLDEIDISK